MSGIPELEGWLTGPRGTHAHPRTGPYGHRAAVFTGRFSAPGLPGAKGRVHPICHPGTGSREGDSRGIPGAVTRGPGLDTE